MRSFAHITRLLIPSAALLLLAACTSNEDENRSAPAINTFKIFIEEAEEAGQKVKNVYSFSPSSNRSQLRAQFNDGENQSFELDTDRSKQGHEYLAFVAPDDSRPELDAVYLLDYDKDTNGRITKLNAFNNDVCGIYPRFKHAQEVINESNRSLSTLVNDERIIVETVATQSDMCNSNNSKLTFELSFNLAAENASDRVNLSQQSLIIRASIVNYAFRDGDTAGQMLYLADNANGNLFLFDDQGRTLWSAKIPNGANSIHAFHVTNTLIAIQANDRLYMRTLTNLLDARSSDDTSTSIEQQVFGNTFLSLSNSNERSPITATSNGSNVLVNDGGTLHLFKEGFFERVSTLPSGTQSVELAINADNEIIALLNYSGFSRLARLFFDGNSWLTSLDILSGQDAEKIEFYFAGPRLYVNTFNLGGATNWQMHYFTALNQRPSTYELSKYLLSATLEVNASDEIWLLQAATAGANGLFNPEVFVFDPTDSGGIQRQRDANGEIIRDSISGIPKPASYTVIPGDVVDIPARVTKENDVFIRLRGILAQGANQVRNQYALDPTINTSSAGGMTSVPATTIELP